MKQTIYIHDFIEAFNDCKRIENFTTQALETLYNYLKDYEEDTGVEYNLDVIGLCHCWEEKNVDDIIEQYLFTDMCIPADEYKVEFLETLLNNPDLPVPDVIRAIHIKDTDRFIVQVNY